MSDVQTAGRPRPHHRSAIHARRPSPGAPALVVTLACAGAVAAGAWLRLWLLAHVPMDSDQAVVGLMADQLLHGHFSAFYWGQTYGGVEPLAVAAVVAVLGHGAGAVNATATALEVVVCAAVWWLTRAVGATRPVGAVAAALAWVWPMASVWSSVREFGFRQAALVLGLVLLAFGVRIARDGGGWVR